MENQIKELLGKFPSFKAFVMQSVTMEEADVCITLDSKETRQYALFSCWPDLIYVHLTNLNAESNHQSFDFAYGPLAIERKEENSPTEWIVCSDLTHALNQLELKLEKFLHNKFEISNFRQL